MGAAGLDHSRLAGSSGRPLVPSRRLRLETEHAAPSEPCPGDSHVPFGVPSYPARQWAPPARARAASDPTARITRRTIFTASSSYSYWSPDGGRARQLSGDPQQGDKPLHRPTPNGLQRRCFIESAVRAMIEAVQARGALARIHARRAPCCRAHRRPVARSLRGVGSTTSSPSTVRLGPAHRARRADASPGLAWTDHQRRLPSPDRGGDPLSAGVAGLIALARCLGPARVEAEVPLGARAVQQVPGGLSVVAASAAFHAVATTTSLRPGAARRCSRRVCRRLRRQRLPGHPLHEHQAGCQAAGRRSPDDRWQRPRLPGQLPAARDAGPALAQLFVR